MREFSENKKLEARERLRAAVRGRDVVLVEGWLLYQNPEIRKLADIRLFLRTSKVAAKHRRMKRPRYGDPDMKDFWCTEEYFEDCVWGNYIKNNEWLFEKGDVEGKPAEKLCEMEGITMQPKLDMNVKETLE